MKKLFPIQFAAVFMLCVSFFLSFPVAGLASSEKIAVVVNDGAISMSDLNDRMTLVIRSSGLPDSQEIREKIGSQVLTGLIEEELKLQETERLGIEVTQAEVDNGFATVAQQNNFTPEQFKEILKRSQINIRTMQRQIRSQVGWTKVVQAQIRPQVNVSENDVSAARLRIENNIGKTEYRVAEIFLPFESPEDAGSVQQLANRLTSQIKSGQAPFPKVAQQFSKSAGASKGGDLGWIQEGQLDPELDRALSAMETKTVSNPIRTVAGYHLLLLLDKRNLTQENMPDNETIMNQIGTERMERLQRKYLMDLKAGAFIENRV